MRKKLVATGIVLALAIGPVAQVSAATLPAATKASLIFMVEEEKLARDVYAALDAVSISPKFKNISGSEQTHMDAVALLLKTYGIKNPTIGKAPGEFTDKSLTALYKTLVAKGKLSELDAISVGILIEKKDLADLATLSKTVKKADIKFTIANLKKGSENHLAAFQR